MNTMTMTVMMMRWSCHMKPSLGGGARWHSDLGDNITSHRTVGKYAKYIYISDGQLIHQIHFYSQMSFWGISISVNFVKAISQACSFWWLAQHRMCAASDVKQTSQSIYLEFDDWNLFDEMILKLFTWWILRRYFLQAECVRWLLSPTLAGYFSCLRDAKEFTITTEMNVT